ncbi:hypothetical protein [Flavobacterium aurantiibacter]|uniref:Uncharacterized protein n=1 Tax=Flavobacterium aurantiibacter TaxID=2023067 RepID=A0A255ZXU6_9FLAO|nr:hypothetical protein [Flavobacterium aurantiibacter]OYQ46377.1 hypothetical protein CHX27_04550 [Flavobacterium aurantiibacter]
MKKLFLFALIFCSSVAAVAQSALPAFNNSKNPHNKAGYDFYLFINKHVALLQEKKISPDELRDLLTKSTYPYKGVATEKQTQAYLGTLEKLTFSSSEAVNIENSILAKPVTADSNAILYQVALLKWSAFAFESMSNSARCLACIEACGDRCMRKKAAKLSTGTISEKVFFLLECGAKVLTWYADCLGDCIEDYRSH